MLSSSVCTLGTELPFLEISLRCPFSCVEVVELQAHLGHGVMDFFVIVSWRGVLFDTMQVSSPQLAMAIDPFMSAVIFTPYPTTSVLYQLSRFFIEQKREDSSNNLAGDG